MSPKPISSSISILMGPVSSVSSLKVAASGDLCFRFQMVTHEITRNGHYRSCFHSVAVWGAYAEVAARIVEPKRRIQVTGKLISYQYGKGPRYVEVKVDKYPIILLHRDIDEGPEDGAPELAWREDEYAEDEPLLPEEQE